MPKNSSFWKHNLQNRLIKMKKQMEDCSWAAFLVLDVCNGLKTIIRKRMEYDLLQRGLKAGLFSVSLGFQDLDHEFFFEW
jgi:hypothetical protein